MKIETTEFKEEHGEQAVEAYLNRYRRLRSSISVLPDREDERSDIADSLLDMNAQYLGLVAFIGDELVGLVGGYPIDHFKGRERGIYCPEWGFFAAEGIETEVVRALYGEMSRKWKTDSIVNQAIAVFADEPALREALIWHEFGLHVVDTIRSTAPLKGPKCPGVQVSPASIEDADIYATLCDLLAQHVSAPPISFYIENPRTRDTYYARLAAEKRHVWIAEKKGQAIGYIQCDDSVDDVSYSVLSESGVAITGAYVLPEYRGSGVSEFLLDSLLAWARSKGKTTCSVDFESSNGFAAGFWLRYFKPVCYSLLRRVDPRTVE